MTDADTKLRLGCTFCGHLFDTAEDLAMHGRRAHGTQAVEIAVDCPYCGESVVFMPSSQAVHGKNWGPLWRCDGCDAHVGCNPGSNRPLGRLANKALREAKVRAHAAVDPLWQHHGLRRRETYQRLAKALGLPVNRCHIGQFDTETCERAIVAAAKIKAEIEGRKE